MFLAPALTIAAAGLASAAPAACPAPHHDPTLSKGFRLVVNVTDPTADFKKTPINGLQLSSIHAGAGVEMPTVTKDGATFYSGSDKTVNLAISGSSPYGLTQAEEPSSPLLYGLGINIAEATKGFEVVKPESQPMCTNLRGPRVGSFVVCDNGFSAPEFAQLEVRFLEASRGIAAPMPDNCVAVTFLPECAPIDLSEATYDHSNLVDTVCHAGKVVDIDWSKQKYC
jgi:hypothetical protein